MTKVISIHSFRGGTGKSNIIANLAVTMAGMGKRIGIVDTGSHSPGIQIIFGLNESSKDHSLNDYLYTPSADNEKIHDVTKSAGENVSGKVFLIPPGKKTDEATDTFTHKSRENYDPVLLTEAFHLLGEKLKLDAFLIDTHPGIHEETLISMAISNTALIILRPDQQDYLGTSVTVELALRLQVEKLFLLVNKAPLSLNAAQIKEKVEETYQCPVAAVIPHSEEMLLLGSSGIFVVHHPNHDITKSYKQAAEMLLA